MDFTRERNDDLMRAYREQRALANYIIMPEIFEKVAESPAKRFWVSEERAAVEVSRMLVGKPFSCFLYYSSTWLCIFLFCPFAI